MIYICVRVRVGLRRRHLDPRHGRVAHVEVADHLVVGEGRAGFAADRVVRRHARQRNGQGREIHGLVLVVAVRGGQAVEGRVLGIRSVDERWLRHGVGICESGWRRGGELACVLARKHIGWLVPDGRR